jgi:hypothetical protein
LPNPALGGDVTHFNADGSLKLSTPVCFNHLGTGIIDANHSVVRASEKLCAGKTFAQSEQAITMGLPTHIAGDGERFVVRADEKLTASLELELDLACCNQASP